MTAFFRIGMRLAVLAICISVSLANAEAAFGQIFGIELHNNVMPASGGMGGASVAQPQDLLSAINGNPATMSQFRGTQFSFGGVWVEPTVNLDHTGGVLPGIGTFSGKSGTPGSALGNIGVTRELSDLGLPVTAGVALISASGIGVDYAAQPNSNNSAVTVQILQLQPGLSIQLTDRLAIGGTFGLGIGLFDGLFVGSSKATPDYGMRGTFGVTFDPNPSTKIGFYYQSKEKFKFEDAIVLQPFVGPPSVPIDVRGDLPPNIALGIANSSLANGRLLLATDLVYKFWEEATLFEALLDQPVHRSSGCPIHDPARQKGSSRIHVCRRIDRRCSRQCDRGNYAARCRQRDSIRSGIDSRCSQSAPVFSRFRCAQRAARSRPGHFWRRPVPIVWNVWTNVCQFGNLLPRRRSDISVWSGFGLRIGTQ